jgi:hypothetical protein
MKNYNLPKAKAQQAIKSADDALYSQHYKGIFDESDPNHPKYNNGYNYATGQFVSLFGYSENELLAKQHK